MIRDVNLQEEKCWQFVFDISEHEVEDFSNLKECRRRAVLRHFGDPNADITKAAQLQFKAPCVHFIHFECSSIEVVWLHWTRVFVSKDWHAPDTCCDRCAEAAGASLKGLEMLTTQTRRLGGFYAWGWDYDNNTSNGSKPMICESLLKGTSFPDVLTLTVLDLQCRHRSIYYITIVLDYRIYNLTEPSI